MFREVILKGLTFQDWIIPENFCTLPKEEIWTLESLPTFSFTTPKKCTAFFGHNNGKEDSRISDMFT